MIGLTLPGGSPSLRELKVEAMEEHCWLVFLFTRLMLS